MNLVEEVLCQDKNFGKNLQSFTNNKDFKNEGGSKWNLEKSTNPTIGIV